VGRFPIALLALASSAAAVPAQEPREAFAIQLRAEDLYRAGDDEACLELLDDWWRRYPPGSEGWAACTSDDRSWFPGHPASYSALRMLTECARWRVEGARQRGRRPKPATVVWTIVLVGQGHGRRPRSEEELAAGEGERVRLTLDPRLVADDHRVVHQSTWLFREFVSAMTDGRLVVEERFYDLPHLDLPLSATPGPPRHAGLAPDAWGLLWEAVPESVRRDTDWWWVLYPSFVPGDAPDFRSAEFVTGGMATGPDGASPCFLIDDLWLLRKPPHLGEGDYSDEERRAYLPQWLAHEFFHHLFRTWPGFGLEARSHQWFDRSTWPEDFEGRYEVDYYLEALHRRLQPAADPPLHVGLRYAAPPPEVWERVRVADVVGAYEHRPVENDWHRGRIVRDGRRDGKALLRWENEAGVSWQLTPDLEHGVLVTGPDDPYRDTGDGRFRVVLARDDDGRWRPEVVGFRFGGGLYLRVD